MTQNTLAYTVVSPKDPGATSFIVYTNDLPDCNSQSTTILFAADLHYLNSSMNQNLSQLIDWFT